jgi:hypothetical protein
MRRNCVLIMCKLNLPDDVLFVSERLIKILLKIFEDYIEDRNKVNLFKIFYRKISFLVSGIESETLKKI